MPEDLFTMLLSWDLSLLSSQQLQIWHMIPIAIIRCISKERNDRIFQIKSSIEATLHNRIKYTFFL